MQGEYEYKYDAFVLKHLQEVESDVLRVFDNICQKYKIEYFVSFGTAIGAVRHNGFIPWDDDIDVCMMREDYERLRKVPKEEWNGYYLCDPGDDFPAQTKIFPRIFVPNTKFETEFHQYDYFGKNKHIVSPIWFDIFLLDRVEGVEQLKKKVKTSETLKRLYFFSRCRYKLPKGDTSVRKDRYILMIVMNKLLSISKKSSLWLYNLYKKNNYASPDCEYITSYDFGYPQEMVDFCDKYDDVFPTERIKFEDFEVNIQKNYHESLTKLYGDYMQLPPEEKRFNHPPVILDFGEGNVIKS